MADDFFEDEPSEKQRPAKSKKKTPVLKPALKRQSQSVVEQMGLPKQLDLTWAAALIVVAFVAGFLLRGLFIPAASSSSSGQFGAPSGQVAPPLSEEQLKEGPPPGHPAIGESTQTGTGTSPGTGAPGATTPAPTTAPGK